MTTRREFIRCSAAAAGALAINPHAALASPETKNMKGSFTLWQIPSHHNTIGNSYIFRTDKGKVIVMDGGYKNEANTLRGFIGALGNEVEAWFISHPHDDHMEALMSILDNPQDMKIKTVYHSRLNERVIDGEPKYADLTRKWYKTLEGIQNVQVTDIQSPGQEFQFDGMHLKILSTANDIVKNAYNNSSMIMRVWDKSKSMVFLGDAGVECGQKVLESDFKKDLDCDYLQMAHHGQSGCNEHFYRSIHFKACLWCTPLWVWNNDFGEGFNTGKLATIQTRAWMDSIGIRKHYISCIDGLCRID